MTKKILVLLAVALLSQPSFAGCFFGPSLKEAVEMGDVSLVEARIRKGSNVNKKVGKYKDSILHVALENISKGSQYKEIALALIHAGADVNAKNQLDMAPLQLACYPNNLELVQILIEKGADINHRTAKLLGNATSDIEILKYLLMKDANIHARDSQNETALWNAAFSGRTEALKFLLQEGASSEINLRGGFFAETPLYVAAEHGHVLTVRALLEAGADPYIRNKDGISPIQIAANKGYDDVVAELQAGGVRVQAADLRSASQAPSASTSGNSSSEFQKIVRGVKAAEATYDGVQALGHFLGGF